MKTICAAAGIALLVSSVVLGQTPRQPLEFEVASVKPSRTDDGQNAVALGLQMDGAQARIGALPLRGYIAMAYRIKRYQVTGPDWLASERFDLNAKLPAGSTAAQIPDMLQSLLADRFGLRFHREPKDMPVYALIIGKPPLKLAESPVDPDAAPAGQVNIAASGSAAGVAVSLGGGSSYSFTAGKFEGKKVQGRILADVLERYADRPILDMTGLTGAYDFRFEVTPEEYRLLLIRAAVNSGIELPPRALHLLDDGGDPLGEAVAQLGLKLDSRRAPVDLLVVDRVLKAPTEN